MKKGMFLSILLLVVWSYPLYCDEFISEFNALYNNGQNVEALDVLLNNMKEVKKSPSRYGKLIFNFDEKLLTRRLNLSGKMGEVNSFINSGKFRKSADKLVEIIDKYPYYYPAYGILVSLFLKGDTKCVKKYVEMVNPAMKFIYTAVFLYERGKLRKATEMVGKLSHSAKYKNYMPIYKVLGMLPESVVDFKQKADFERKYMRDYKNFKYDF